MPVAVRPWMRDAGTVVGGPGLANSRRACMGDFRPSSSLPLGWAFIPKINAAGNAARAAFFSAGARARQKRPPKRDTSLDLICNLELLARDTSS
jgi:hypothetical protein